MARTWTVFHSIVTDGAISQSCRATQAGVNGVYLGPDGNGDFYYYDGGTSTGTNIGFEDWANAQGGDWASGTSAHGFDAAWFKDELYICANKDPDVSNEWGAVVKYATGTFYEVYAGVSTEFFLVSSGIGTVGKFIAADDSRMIITMVDNSGAPFPGIYYDTTDGITWNLVSGIEAHFAVPKGFMCSKYEEVRRNIITMFGDTSSATITRVMEYGGSSWDDLSGSDLTNTILLSYFANKSWFMVEDGSSNWQIMNSSDYGVTLVSGTSTALGLTPGDPFWRMKDINNDARLANYATSNRVFEYNNDTGFFEFNQALEDPPANPQNVIDYFYLGTTVYLFTDDKVVWEGGELVPATAKFYQGLGTLDYKTDLPFEAVQPHAMALDKSLGTVVVGSNSPDSEMAAYLQGDYTSYTEMDTGIPTGTSISAMEWV